MERKDLQYKSVILFILNRMAMDPEAIIATIHQYPKSNHIESIPNTIPEMAEMNETSPFM